MMEWVVENWVSLIGGGIIAGFWIAARDRRKAVDRILDRLYTPRKPDDAFVCRKVIDEVEAAGWLPGWSAGAGPQKQDAAGRVIARSVERVTKE